MPTYLCITCGTQFAESADPPEGCAVCLDERQFVNWDGQQWTTFEELGQTHRTVLREEDEGLLGVGMEPAFAIGQRALLIETRAGNVLWDCISLVDDAAVRDIRGRGGLAAIAISHPHYYGAMLEWSHAFGGVPVYLHASDRSWVMRSGPELVFWEGETCPIAEGVTLVRCGGHFAGGAVLHWAEGARGKGAILSGDILQVTQDRKYLSFMYSYPNLIPLDAASVLRIARSLQPFRFERIYGAWWRRNILTDAADRLGRSVERYLRSIGA